METHTIETEQSVEEKNLCRDSWLRIMTLEILVPLAYEVWAYVEKDIPCFE